MVVFALVWRHAQTCVPRLGPRERSEYDECSGEDCGLAPTASTLRAIDRSVSDRTPPETRAQPSLTSPPASTSFGGHEWIGGAVGRAERFGNRQRRHASARAPHNSTLLLLGVVSGCKNFDVRNWVRRALWQQRAWRYGVEWRFVVGSTLPRGDNDRVSLHYEAARHGILTSFAAPSCHHARVVSQCAGGSTLQPSSPRARQPPRLPSLG